MTDNSGVNNLELEQEDINQLSRPSLHKTVLYIFNRLYVLISLGGLLLVANIAYIIDRLRFAAAAPFRLK
jgi:hypothetical protein